MVAVTHRTARQMVYPPRTRTRQARPLRGRTTKRALLKAKAHLISLGLSSCPYSPKCVELEFSEVRSFLGTLTTFVPWRTYTALTQGYAAFVTWPAERREKGASKFETVRNDQVTAKITHLREGAPHNTHCSSHNCKCVDGSRVLPRP